MLRVKRDPRVWRSGSGGAETDLVEIARLLQLPEPAERVEIAMPGPAPILEADAQFEARLRRLDELALADPQPREQLKERRDRALAHPQRADIVRFDQVDLDHALILVREDGGGDPPRGATPDRQSTRLNSSH